MVELEKIDNDEDIAELRGLIEKHREYTGSEVLSQFVKVMPTDYKRVLQEAKAAQIRPVAAVV
jgi:glutamate synthase domain-containing protein 3